MTPDELAAMLGSRLGGEVTGLTRMLGGASRETWSFVLDGRPLVLRRNPPGAPRAGAMAREAELMCAAAAAGVPVPAVVASADDYLVMQRLSGETIGRRILRDEKFSTARQRLIEQCAAALARLHTGVAQTDVRGLPAQDDPLRLLRDLLDSLGEPHPALELGLLRLARNRPAPVGRVVVHGDFRLGNLMVGEDGLVGVLDWELAHVGDPAEDLGWLCVRSWRFGGGPPVAGLGTREALVAAYGAAGGAFVDERTLRWWEAYGTLRWGVICVQQAAAHLSGAVRSVELAAIGRRTCEVEMDLLDLVAPGNTPVPSLDPRPQPSGPHDHPTAVELLESVREWLATAPLQGHDAFVAKVASRSLEIVEREIALGAELARRHTDRLAALGVGDNTQLAARVRGGDDSDEVVAAIRDAVVDKLLVADPRLLQRRQGEGSTS